LGRRHGLIESVSNHLACGHISDDDPAALLEVPNMVVGDVDVLGTVMDMRVLDKGQGHLIITI
jgi:hypothetical protein